MVEASGRTVVDYVDSVLPKMFVDADSLSADVIQQFLDELMWRESNGRSGKDAFDNIIRHLAGQRNLSIKKKRPAESCDENFFKAPTSLTCIECNEPIDRERHLYLDPICCMRCGFSTQCGLSMANHQKKHVKKKRTGPLIGNIECWTIPVLNRIQ